ncbi:MAPEG family protein [Echinimonas agarilytica]|uniref:MAPEG family protein n=1 Tax=Echinimonas agarilytica TaxID=1215918 RepID=A0AA41W6R7_9GAMM|nr:MAPEG family protein [Echinimonas agarilytica]MCM2680007.1 MAPEG family protein [Echinimonas agarilytica]
MVVSGLYIALHGLLMIALSIGVIKLRRKHLIGIGDGDNEVLARAIRAHANFTEYVPISLIMIAALDFNGASALTIHILGAALFVSRALHAMALRGSSGKSNGRVFGMMGTFVVIIASSVMLMMQFSSWVMAG